MGSEKTAEVHNLQPKKRLAGTGGKNFLSSFAADPAVLVQLDSGSLCLMVSCFSQETRLLFQLCRQIRTYSTKEINCSMAIVATDNEVALKSLIETSVSWHRGC